MPSRFDSSCAARLLTAALALTLATGCGKDLQRLKILIADKAVAPPGATVSGERAYRELKDVYADLDRVQAEASVALYPSLATLHADAFGRIAHVTDVQVREERATLLGGVETDILESASNAYTPIEGTRRDALMEVNSAYVWLAEVLTLNAVHKQYPLDLVVHTGDATDSGLRSELRRFLYNAHKLEAPFLNVIGNHDVLAFGLWNHKDAFVGVYLNSVDMSASVRTLFDGNGDGLMQDHATHIEVANAAISEIGVHEPTRQAFGSERHGYDLSPDPSGGYYTVVVRAPADGRPGLQLVSLRTSSDKGGADGEMDDAQLAWLNDTLDAPTTRQNVVVIAAHHPLMDVKRSNGGLGAVGQVVEAEPLKKLKELLLHYPNVVAYLCGHTHLPEVVELKDGAGALQLAQIDTGGLLTYPQEGAVVELLLDSGSTQVTVAAQKVGPMIAGGSELAMRVVEAIGSAARDPKSRPAYSVWKSYAGSRALPTFPVDVPKFDR
ncbi:MAG: metallophosphoesterase [Myxococcales bacterium]